MTTASETKALRGTKRQCVECEVRFYDLKRAPIVCPACGVEHKPVAVPVFEIGAKPAGGKSAWRSKSFKRPAPVVEVEPEAAEPADAEAAVTEEAEEETVVAAEPGAEDDIVLEQEADDTDVSDLVGLDEQEPKER
jgi:uncharacterized protein (TIGR02300 family)